MNSLWSCTCQALTVKTCSNVTQKSMHIRDHMCMSTYSARALHTQICSSYYAVQLQSSVISIKNEITTTTKIGPWPRTPELTSQCCSQRTSPTPPPPMSIFNILVETWCSAGYFLWRMAPAIAMNSVTPADTFRKADLQKLYPLAREVRSEDSASETTTSVCLQACAIYCAVFHRHILQIIDYCPALVSISEFADLKKKQILQAYKWQHFFFEWQPDYLVGDHILSWALGPEPCCLGI